MTDPHKVIRCGIFCFAVTPINKEIFLLMARDQIIANWSESGQYSDLGGSRKRCETCDETAAREFLEETLCMINLDSETIPTNTATTMKSIIDCIDTKKYYLKVESKLGKRYDSEEDVYQIIYFFEIPWMPDLPQRFQKSRRQLVMIREKSKALQQIRRCGYADAKCLRQLVAMYHSIGQLETHPALSVKYDEHTNEVYDIRVKREYLEKQYITWWSIPQTVQYLKRLNFIRAHCYEPLTIFLSSLGIDTSDCQRSHDSPSFAPSSS